ncbi:acyl-CoA thioesterase [Rhizobium alvei]|uniref:Thioesterase family protein n=1 Tax=Rhizobium alvei TaxID=1132659 RepID=A0ABT8YL96_9HYPH|nr:thioesterase family protein [Rhizobium alvei]MDO6964364.1 thioesterase family protein [Rhizobium alvei]
MIENTRTVEIEWGDCDAAGIVFYPRYFAIFDASTAYLLEKAFGMKKAAWTKAYGIVGIPMVDTGASFSNPCTYGDVVSIHSKVSELGRSSFSIEHRILKDGKEAIRGHEKRVWTGRYPDDPERLMAVPLPDSVRAALMVDETSTDR